MDLGSNAGPGESRCHTERLLRISLRSPGQSVNYARIFLASRGLGMNELDPKSLFANDC
jgi:hypothetical protein